MEGTATRTDGAFYFMPGANPTIVFYNATSSLVRSENKNIFFDFVKTL
jgi:hypothetical protein